MKSLRAKEPTLMLQIFQCDPTLVLKCHYTFIVIALCVCKTQNILYNLGNWCLRHCQNALNNFVNSSPFQLINHLFFPHQGSAASSSTRTIVQALTFPLKSNTCAIHNLP